MSPQAVVRGVFAVGVALVTLSLGVGCSGTTGNPKTVPVTGTVMYKGEPVEGATVSFWAEKAPRAAAGVTNAKGEFSLSMFGANDGAMLGESKITVSKVAASAAGQSSASKPEDLLNDPSAMAKSSGSGTDGSLPEAPKALLPEKYGTSTSTPLKETVTASGPNKFVLQLTD